LKWLTAIGGFLFLLSLILLMGPQLLFGATPPETAIRAGVFLMMAAASLGSVVTLLIVASLVRDWRTRNYHQRMRERERIDRRLFG
jgi:hypothetical protein